MSRSSSGSTTTSSNSNSKKLKGVRRRKWGKWVSEIRVPGTQERLWLGTYATPEAAAVAHDVAVYCLRRPSSLEKLNFPETLSSYSVFQQQQQNRELLSPRSVQRIASDVGMDVDARNIANNAQHERGNAPSVYNSNNSNNNSIIDDDDSSWWDDLGADYASSHQGQADAMSISVEDYL